jgi:L-arabinonolactonase
MEVERVVEVRNYLGEGPIWNPAEQAVYWLNISSGTIFQWKPASKKMQSWTLGFPIGTIGLRAGGGLALATKRGLGVWDAETGFTVIANPIYAKPNMRFNDGKIDPRGRFWAGTMTDAGGKPEPGVLYRLDADASLHVIRTGCKVPNGLAWSLDRKTMYWTDTGFKTIYAYDYDDETGHVENPRPFIVVPDTPGEGSPDGMTMDSEGFFWGARWGGWKVVRYDPEGKLERTIELPVERPSSVAFGGKDLDELYISTAAQAISDEERKKQPWIGDLLVVRPGVKGRPEPLFAG